MMLVSLPSPASPNTPAAHQERPRSAKIIPTAINKRLGPSTSDPRTLKHSPKENMTPNQRKKFPQRVGGNQYSKTAASKNQHTIFCTA